VIIIFLPCFIESENDSPDPQLQQKRHDVINTSLMAPGLGFGFQQLGGGVPNIGVVTAIPLKLGRVTNVMFLPEKSSAVWSIRKINCHKPRLVHGDAARALRLSSPSTN